MGGSWTREDSRPIQFLSKLLGRCTREGESYFDVASPMEYIISNFPSSDTKITD